jgi:phosphoribosylaminoimidazole (AIR) synthetase
LRLQQQGQIDDDEMARTNCSIGMINRGHAKADAESAIKLARCR